MTEDERICDYCRNMFVSMDGTTERCQQHHKARNPKNSIFENLRIMQILDNAMKGNSENCVFHEPI